MNPKQQPKLAAGTESGPEHEANPEHEAKRCLICDQANQTNLLAHGVCSVCEAEAENVRLEVYLEAKEQS